MLTLKGLSGQEELFGLVEQGCLAFAFWVILMEAPQDVSLDCVNLSPARRNRYSKISIGQTLI